MRTTHCSGGYTRNSSRSRTGDCPYGHGVACGAHGQPLLLTRGLLL